MAQKVKEKRYLWLGMPQWIWNEIVDSIQDAAAKLRAFGISKIWRSDKAFAIEAFPRYHGESRIRLYWGDIGAAGIKEIYQREIDKINALLSVGSLGEPVEKKKRFKAPFRVETWFERGYGSLTISDAEDVTVAHWEDEDLQGLIEDGFLDPQDWTASAIEYAVSVGLIPLKKEWYATTWQGERVMYVPVLRMGSYGRVVEDGIPVVTK